MNKSITNSESTELGSGALGSRSRNVALAAVLSCRIFSSILSIFIAVLLVAPPDNLGDEIEDLKKTIADLKAANAQLVGQIIVLKTEIATFGERSPTPTESDAKAVLQAHIDEESEHRIELNFFRKTDGQKGFGLYRMTYEAEFQVRERCFWGPLPMGSWAGEFFTTVGNPKTDLQKLSPEYFMKVEAKRGDRVEFKGALILEKSETGWHGRMGDSSIVAFNVPNSIARAGNTPTTEESKPTVLKEINPTSSSLYVELKISNHLGKSIKVYLDGSQNGEEIKSQHILFRKYPANSKHHLKLVGFFGEIEKDFEIHEEDLEMPIN